MSFSESYKARISGYLLLALFSLLLIPREVLHECHSSDQHSEQHSGDHQSLHDDSHCAVCDFHFHQYLSPQKVEVAEGDTQFTIHDQRVLSSIYVSPSYRIPGRAPPISL